MSFVNGVTQYVLIARGYRGIEHRAALHPAEVDGELARLIDQRNELLGARFQGGGLVVAQECGDRHDRQDADHRDQDHELGEREALLGRLSRE